MTTVELTVGYPASGKTTYAKQRVIEAGGRLRRVSMDDLRGMLDCGIYSPRHEKTALKIQDEIIRRSVRDGYDIIVDNTHIQKRMPERIRAVLAPHDVTWVVTDFRDVPVDECIRRDKEREMLGQRSVGAEVIERMVRRRPSWSLSEAWLNDYPKPKLYIPSLIATRAVICDLDGTLAIHQGRDPYDTSRCGEDACNVNIATLLDSYQKLGVSIILVTGRDEKFREQTRDWLYRFQIPYNFLFMRPAGDLRRDDIVKAELFDQYIRDDFHVLFALDDRDRVVNMWRSINLMTWQVAEGDF